MSGIAAVIPAYNEAKTVREIATLAAVHVDWVIVVDDGSEDGTSEALVGAPLIVLRNERNLGKAASLWRGMEHAWSLGADLVVTLDGDGQHRPEEIARLLAVAKRDPEALVVGARTGTSEDRPARRLCANRVADHFISRAAGRLIADTQSGFRVYPRRLFQRIDVRHGERRGFVFESEVLIKAARAGFAIETVPVSVVYGNALRPSHFRPVRDITRITLMVAGYLFARTGTGRP